MNRPMYWYVRVRRFGRMEKLSNNPMCDRCADRAWAQYTAAADRAWEQYAATGIELRPAGRLRGQCVRCGTDYEDPEEQRRYAESERLKRLYRDADRAAERGP